MFHRLSVRRAGLVALSAIAAASCSAAPPLPVEKGPAVNVAAQDATPGGAAQPSLDPVAEPGNLNGIIRIGSPAQDTLIWRALLPPTNPIGQLFAQGIDGTVAVILGSLGEQVDTALPFDFAVLRKDTEKKKDDVLFVGSMVLRNLGEARTRAAADFDFRDAADGSIDVKPRRGAKNAGVVTKLGIHCRIFPGGEPVASHLVCGGSAEDVTAAGPYLARNVSRMPVVPGMQYDIPETVLSRMLADVQADTEAKMPDSSDEATLAGRKLGMQWTKQFVADFASFGMNLSGNGNGISIGADFHMRSVRSPLSLWTIGAQPGPVPAMFWSLPQDADLALALPGAPKEATQKAIGPTFWTDLKAAMPSAFPAEVSEGLTTQLGKLLFSGGPVVFAHGPTASKVSAGPAGADPAKRYATARQTLAGWVIVGMPEPASKWTAGTREIVRLLRGQSKPTKTTPNQREISALSEVAVRATDGLPSGSIHVLDDVKPNGAYREEDDPKRRPALIAPYQNHVFVGGNDQMTWIALSENEALARTKLHEAMTGDAGSIKARSELAPLKSLPPGGVGFGTMKSVVSLVGDVGSFGEITSHLEKLVGLSALPGRGEEPVFLSLASTPNGKGGVTLRMTATFSLVAATDIIQFVQ